MKPTTGLEARAVEEAPDVPGRPATTGAGPMPNARRSRRRPDRTRRFAVAAAILLLSAIGWAMLIAGETEADARDRVGASGSSIEEFLRPAGGTGTARIRIERDNAMESVVNGGTVALSDDLALAITVSPYPPTTFDVDVDVRLITSDGSPVDDASIGATWDMAVMFHGPFETPFEPSGDGHYRAHFDFFMYGPWELITHVSTPSHDTPDDLPLSIYVWPE